MEIRIRTIQIHQETTEDPQEKEENHQQEQAGNNTKTSKAMGDIALWGK